MGQQLRHHSRRGIRRSRRQLSVISHASRYASHLLNIEQHTMLCISQPCSTALLCNLLERRCSSNPIFGHKYSFDTSCPDVRPDPNKGVYVRIFIASCISRLYHHLSYTCRMCSHIRVRQVYQHLTAHLSPLPVSKPLIIQHYQRPL